jgi:hypothetical protein
MKSRPGRGNAASGAGFYDRETVRAAIDPPLWIVGNLIIFIFDFAHGFARENPTIPNKTQQNPK